MKSIQNPQGNKNVHFTKTQGTSRKDVERAFGILQSRFAIVAGLARFWVKKTLWRIMTTCVILHNMIIEDERDQPEDFDYETVGNYMVPVEPEKDKHRIEKILEVLQHFEDKVAHAQLRDDLVEHFWQLRGSV